MNAIGVFIRKSGMVNKEFLSRLTSMLPMRTAIWLLQEPVSFRRCFLQ